MQFNFDHTYIQLPQEFFYKVQPAHAPAPNLLAFNHELALELGISNSNSVTDEELAQFFSGNKQLPGSMIIAQAYAGHQFGHFVPQLGDGRAMLLGEIITPTGKRLDIQLKGPGQTPFSRRGDGKSAIGPVIREYLISEAMYHLGVPTTRALAAVQTGEMVQREQLIPGAVMTRIAASHIRIGTFQFFAARGNTAAIKILADYCIKRHYPNIADDSNKYINFLKNVCQRQLALIAQWMSIGFIHGVMNTDNMSISGETIDYGPCAFMDNFEFQKVFSSIDQHGRYSYSNQGAIAMWNLTRLAECLITLIHDDESVAIEMLQTELTTLPGIFETQWLKRMAAKIGIVSPVEEDRDLIMLWLHILENDKLDFTLNFRQLSKIVLAEKKDKESPAMLEFLTRWKTRLRREPGGIEHAVKLMNSVNPSIIPRNHQIERAIAQVIAGDLKLFQQLHEAFKLPFTAQTQFTDLELAPLSHQCVLKTFCGT